jgi:diketogulonate reductase-like aldo/keto reductase
VITQWTASRREFMASAAGVALAGLAPGVGAARQAMPSRAIPASGEQIPVIGAGTSKVVDEIATHGPGPVSAVLRALVDGGGRLVDAPSASRAPQGAPQLWLHNGDNEAAFGKVISEPALKPLFVTLKIDQIGNAEGQKQFEDTQRRFNRRPVDLTQIFNLIDIDNHWPSARGWKDAGLTRYLGVTVGTAGLYDILEKFLAREKPDFVQINYSITERDSEARLLPMLADRGIAVIINRPFMNGTYFKRLADRPLPGWASEFGCTSWAQFSLKYILANPAPTCILTETSNPKHMAENAQAGFGAAPTEAHRRQMRELIDGLKV